MSKTLIVILTVVVLFALVGGALAWAKHRGLCRHGGLDWLQARVASRLDLNEPQRERLKALAEQLLGLRDQWLETRRQGRGELLALLDAPSLDRERAEALLAARHLAWQARSPGLVAAFADFSDSLSAEQRGRLRGMIERPMGQGCRH
jgi:Spy/CpxP family protein refolding chaperone